VSAALRMCHVSYDAPFSLHCKPLVSSGPCEGTSSRQVVFLSDNGLLQKNFYLASFISAASSTIIYNNRMCVLLFIKLVLGKLGDNKAVLSNVLSH
jgi:hypothetical protein